MPCGHQGDGAGGIIEEIHKAFILTCTDVITALTKLYNTADITDTH